MAIEHVAIGTRVTTSDGASIGRVTRFVIDTESGRLSYVAFHHRPLGTERLIDTELITKSTATEITLSIDSEAAKQLSPVVTNELVQTRGPQTIPVSSGGMVDIAGTGNHWFRYDDDSVFETVPFGTIVTETVSTIPEGSLVIGKETHVFTSDEFDVGHVDTLSLDGQLRVTGFVMTAGHLYRHHVQIPRSWVAGVTDKRIRLSKGLDESMDALPEYDVWPV
jgi:sporulation protein YlmC with PRC-barrel domain